MSQSNTQPRRNEAVRVFAPEFNESTIEFQDPEEVETQGKQTAPKYVLLPTGGRANRVLIAGTLTNTAQVSDNTIRARIVGEAGGTYFCYASQQYSKEAYADLQELDSPEFLMVVGKPNVYTTDSGETNVSIDPENVVAVEKATRDRCVAETAAQTLDRLDALENGDAPFQAQVEEHYDYDYAELRAHVREVVDSLSAEQASQAESDEESSGSPEDVAVDDPEVDPEAAAT
ncbi:hypothetical protein GCM10027355_35970 [Haloplanus salinarum]|uniref:DNA-binding protein n=1 Tax=Haloplanus salinarum TaxID=1912324 RepID=UPI003B4373BB